MVKLSSLVQQFNILWPDSGREQWDKPGLMLGSDSQEISKVLLSVDITNEVLDEAIASDAQLILSHHPMFLRGVHHLSSGTAKGAYVAKAVTSGIAVYAAHTNADFVPGGVSDTLGLSLGLTKLSALSQELNQGFVGELQKPLSLFDFARLVAKVLPPVAQGIMVAGDKDRMISRVGLLAGAGDSYLPEALNSQIDLFITSDLRHHPSQDFIEQSSISGGPSLINISHFAAEFLWLARAKSQLEQYFDDVEFSVTELSTDPWDFVVMQ